MPRNISFALTTQQVRNRTKTVTRRAGWLFLKAGDILCDLDGLGAPALAALAHPKHGSLADRAATRFQFLGFVFVGLDPADVSHAARSSPPGSAFRAIYLIGRKVDF